MLGRALRRDYSAALSGGGGELGLTAGRLVTSPTPRMLSTMYRTVLVDVVNIIGAVVKYHQFDFGEEVTLLADSIRKKVSMM